MLIFKKDDIHYVFIHIPKNGGKYLRKKIETDPTNTIIQSYWGIKNGIDYAHIPYIHSATYLDPDIKYNFFTYSRNPYHRMISAYFDANRSGNIAQLNEYVHKSIPYKKFDWDLKNGKVHFYPQYLYVSNEHELADVEIKKLEEFENPRLYDIKEYLDDESIAIINRVYEKDFLLFGYEMI
jgi:hypothetical protein